MKSSQQEFDGQIWLKAEYVIYWGLMWSAISLILYLTFSVVDPDNVRPQWFILVTTGFEEIGLVISGCLCLRNWQSEYISSGRTVWLLFAIAIAAFFIGNLWFCWWEILWGLEPAASAGNIFFVLFYLILIAGVRLAILDRDVQLGERQWVLVLGIALVGLTVGCWLTTFSAKAQLPPSMTATIGLQRSIDVVTQLPAQPIATPKISRSNLPLLSSSKFPSRAASPPGWVMTIDRAMRPLVTTFNLFYVLCDLVLMILAAILLLGFWGGQLGLPWRMTAQAVLCFYIADTWFAYANNQMQGYESGFIMEVFWIFGIVQFGIAAALEFDNSIRAHRLTRRRTAIK